MTEKRSAITAINMTSPYGDFIPVNAATKGTIYISGPMRGAPAGDYNYPVFNDLAAHLRSLGWTVNNPAENFGGDSGRKFEEYMREDLRMVADSDAIALMPGWQNSEGARDELRNAIAIGLDIYEAQVVSDTWVLETRTVQDVRNTIEGLDQRARRLVYGERAATYGHPRGDFAVISGFWREFLKGRLTFLMHYDEDALVRDIPWEELLSDKSSTIMMSLLKHARLTKDLDHEDSTVDSHGYLLCKERLNESPAEISAWRARNT